RVGVDTGGTFTDFVYQAGGDLLIFKVGSTPDDPSRAISDGLRRVADETGIALSLIEVVHGTTVGTNALLQRRGARTALVTTAGFEDVIEIGREAPPELYTWNARTRSTSSQILPEYREYEHTSTVTVNAYLQPLMGRYLRRLTRTAAIESKRSSKKIGNSKLKTQNSVLRVMQSSGGSISAEAAANE